MLASLHDSRQFSLRFSDHNVSDQGWSECHSGPHAGSQKQRFALVGTDHGYLSRACISCCCCHSSHLVNWHGAGESQQLSDRTTLQRQLYTNKLSYSCKPSADGVHLNFRVQDTIRQLHPNANNAHLLAPFPEAGMGQTKPNQKKNTLQPLRKLDQATPCSRLELASEQCLSVCDSV